MSKEIIKKYEDILNKLPGVISSKVVIFDDEIVEIHILSNKNRSPKQISRDIQSAFAARFDVLLDRKVISVAQIDYGEQEFVNSRLILDSISYNTSSDNLAEAKVILKLADEEQEGFAKGINSVTNAHRLLVNATLDSIHKLFDFQDKIVVEDVEKYSLAKNEVVAVAVSVMDNYNEDLVIGSAVIKKDERESVVRATLDALNRKLHQF